MEVPLQNILVIDVHSVGLGLGLGLEIHTNYVKTN